MLDRKLEAKLSKDGIKVSLERRGEDYAGVGRRLVAGFVDWVVAMVIGAVGGLFVSIGFIVLASVMRDPHGGANMASVGATFLYPPATFAVATLVHLFFGIRASRRGDTPGHRSVGLKIASADGSRVGWPRALARQFMGSPLLVLLYVMGFLYVANNYFLIFCFNSAWQLNAHGGIHRIGFSYSFRRLSLSRCSWRVFWWRSIMPRWFSTVNVGDCTT